MAAFVEHTHPHGFHFMTATGTKQATVKHWPLRRMDRNCPLGGIQILIKCTSRPKMGSLNWPDTSNLLSQHWVPDFATMG